MDQQKENPERLTPDQAFWSEVFAVFETLAELPNDQWREQLRLIANPAIKNEVAALLKGHEQIRSTFLNASPIPKPEFPGWVPGERIGKWLIRGHIADGAFARVFHAIQIELDRDVALKVSSLPAEEARIMAKLSHPGIVDIFEVDTISYPPWTIIVMKYVRGQTYADLLHRLEGNHQEHRIGRILTRVCEAIAFAHQRCILHLDIKPSNILIDEHDNPALTDFNVSTKLSGTGLVAEDGKILGGTPGYVAPEVLNTLEAERNRKINGNNFTTTQMPITTQADIYGLGKVIEDTAKALDGDDLTTRQFRNSLHAISQRCTHASPRERPKSSDDVGAAIKAATELALFTKTHSNNAKQLLTIVLLAIAPNFFAAIVQIAYNYTYIIKALTAQQNNAFIATLAPWNIFIFTVGSSWVLAGIRADLPQLRTISAIDSLRKRLLQATAIGWTIGLLLFVAILNANGEISRGLLLHLISSFGLAGSLALLWSLLTLSVLENFVVLPAMLNDVTPVAPIATARLQKMLTYVPMTTTGAVLIALSTSIVAALLVETTTFSWKVLVVGLTSIGALTAIGGSWLSNLLRVHHGRWQTLKNTTQFR